AALRYKTNEPGGNTFLYTAAPNGGTLGGVSSPGPLGTWSVTFSHDTNITVTTPGGAAGNFTLSAATAALFTNPLPVYIGVQPNTGANIGQTVVLNSFQILTTSEVFGDHVVLADNFLADADLDPATWRVAAGNAAGVQLVGPDAAFWLQWTTPDSGFGLQTTANPTDANSWGGLGWTVAQMGSVKRVFVHSYNGNPEPNKTYAPAPDFSFFRLMRQ